MFSLVIVFSTLSFDGEASTQDDKQPNLKSGEPEPGGRSDGRDHIPSNETVMKNLTELPQYVPKRGSLVWEVWHWSLHSRTLVGKLCFAGLSLKHPGETSPHESAGRHRANRAAPNVSSSVNP